MVGTGFFLPPIWEKNKMILLKWWLFPHIGDGFDVQKEVVGYKEKSMWFKVSFCRMQHGFFLWWSHLVFGALIDGFAIMRMLLLELIWAFVDIKPFDQQSTCIVGSEIVSIIYYISILWLIWPFCNSVLMKLSMFWCACCKQFKTRFRDIGTLVLVIGFKYYENNMIN